MTLGRLKFWYFVVGGLGSLVTSYYFNFLFFLLHEEFGFGNRENLAAAAMHGSLYIVAAWQCGKFAERRGFHTSMKLGFGGLCASMLLGWVASSVFVQMIALVGYTVSVCFIWPAIEALVTEHEPPSRVPHMIGVYNCNWSTAAAISYFGGGSLFQWLGKVSLFGLPALVALLLLLMVHWLEGHDKRLVLPRVLPVDRTPHPEPAAFSQVIAPKTFLQLAWVANPFSYVAIYTLIATMPGLAEKFGLSPAGVGLFCSVWLFGRLAAFVVLWHWSGWHYNFRYLVLGFALLTASFVAMLLSPSLWLVIAAQVVFGVTCGLMYYSSLFYAMDVGDAKGEHGGLHEAAIGAGIFAGPAVGALSLQLFPHVANASAMAVSGLLVVGLGAIVAVGRRRGRAS